MEVRWSEGSSDDGQIESNSENNRESIEGNYKFSFAANIQKHNFASKQSELQKESRIQSNQKHSIQSTEPDIFVKEKECEGFIKSRNTLT